MPNQKAAEVVVPKVRIGFDDLLVAIRQLDEMGRATIARVLLETQLDDEMRLLLQALSTSPSHSDISDAEIQDEVRAVRAS